jgi:hypothetical protein
VLATARLHALHVVACIRVDDWRLAERAARELLGLLEDGDELRELGVHIHVRPRILVLLAQPLDTALDRIELLSRAHAPGARSRRHCELHALMQRAARALERLLDKLSVRAPCTRRGCRSARAR